MRSSRLDLLLVRHGLTDWNERGRLLGRSPIALNARGQAQAKAVAAALRDVPVGLILASPQRRAQDTAAAIAAVHGLAARTEEGLAEVWLGRWQGKAWQELQDDPDVQHFLADVTYVCDAIEPTAQVQQRVVAVVERLRVEATGCVVLVSHGDPLRVLVAHYLGLPLSAYRNFSIDTGSISLVHCLPSAAPRLVLLNWQPARELKQLVW